MKSLPALALTLALGFSAVACGDDNPAAPSNPDIRFTATLLAANETPTTVTGPEAAATGTLNAVLKTTKDAGGNITAATVDFTVTLAGFPTTSTITAAHIHPGAAGTAGGALVSLGLTSGEVAISATGTGSVTKNGITMDAANAQAMINNPASFYFNVHSAAFPGGVVRGQMVKQ